MLNFYDNILYKIILYYDNIRSLNSIFIFIFFAQIHGLIFYIYFIKMNWLFNLFFIICFPIFDGWRQINLFC